MAGLLLLIAVIAYFRWQSYSINKKIDNYPLTKVDSVKMCMDINASPKQKRINMINGKYDVTPYEKMTKAQQDYYDVKERMGLNEHPSLNPKIKSKASCPLQAVNRQRQKQDY